MDTRFWGPSGWQLLHLIAFKSPPQEARRVLESMEYILPCKFCRESTALFVKQYPLTLPYGRWLYELHNMVNNKLRTQCSSDPNVIDPGPDPDFEDVKSRYDKLVKPDAVPGRDFLMAISYNFPASPEPRDMSIHREFLHHLAEAYPFERLRTAFQTYIGEREPDLSSQATYTRWMYGLMRTLSEKINIPIRSYRAYMRHLAYYKSGCKRKSYRGKTCRRITGGRTTLRRNRFSLLGTNKSRR